MPDYRDDIFWRELQQYLPEGHRLVEAEEVPAEHFQRMGRQNIHLDIYPQAAPKARVLLLHGVGGNGRLLSCFALPLWRQDTMLHPEIETEPEDFARCPISHVHPAEDHWTDVSLSRLFFDRLGCKKELHLLEGAGHFPLEPAALQQCTAFCLSFLARH